jgi:hypothetical protein
MKHDCRGYVFYKGCIDCAVRAISVTPKGSKQEASLFEYFRVYHDHYAPTLTASLDVARQLDQETLA